MYIKIIDGMPQAYSATQLRRDNPNTSFPAVLSDALLAEHGVYKITRAPLPSFDQRTQYLKEAGFTQLGGKWITSYTVEPLPKAQIEFNIKAERDRLLAESDWVVAKAAEVQNPTPPEWVAYRQQLRDIPSQAGFPYAVVWPSKP